MRELIRSRGLCPGDLLPTYHELSKATGVSYVTVKRGLDRLAAEGLVTRVASKGTFVTKELALIPRKLEHLGVILSSSRNAVFRLPYVGEILRGATDHVPDYADIHFFSLRQDGMVRATQLGEWKVSGVLLINVENDDYLRAFARWGTPGVVVDYCSQAAPLDYVACDNRGAARQMAAHLVALGHRRVDYVTPFSRSPVVRRDNPDAILLYRDSSDVREREAECVDALRASGMLADVRSLRSEEWAGYAAELRQRRRADRPTVVMTSDNHVAFTLLGELKRRGLGVPEDVSVCAVASDGEALFGGPLLTCCRFDFVGMGAKAVELLATRCRNPGLSKPHVHRIGFTFMEGQTCGTVGPSR